MLNISFFIAAFSSIFWLIYSLNFIYAPLPNMEQLYRSVLIIALPIILIWGLFITIRSYYAAQNASARTFAILEQLKKQTENMETLGCALLSAEKEIKNGFILREFDTLIADANEILADIIKRSNSISSAQMEHLWSRTAGGERWLIAKTFIETYNFQSGFTEHLLQRAQKDPLLKGSILEFQARIKGLYRIMEVYDTQRIFYNIIASGALGRTYELITPIAEKLTQAKNIEEKPKRQTANVQPSVTAANSKIYTLTEEQDISFPSFLTRPANAPQSAPETPTDVSSKEDASKPNQDIDAGLKAIRDELLATSPQKERPPLIKSFANTQSALRNLKKEPNFSATEQDQPAVQAQKNIKKDKPVISLDELEKEINASPENNYDEYAYPFGAWLNEKKNK